MVVLWWILVWTGGVVIVGLMIALFNVISLAFAMHRQPVDSPATASSGRRTAR
jgi:hypothetical protein